MSPTCSRVTTWRQSSRVRTRARLKRCGRLPIVSGTIEIDSDLRERHLSAGPLDDFTAALEATWRDFDLVHAGGESSAAAQARVSRAIRRIAAT